MAPKSTNVVSLKRSRNGAKNGNEKTKTQRFSKWNLLAVPDHREDYDGHRDAVRLNSLGSLFFFTQYTLQKTRLTTLHKYLCKSLESEKLRLVMEVPMSHYKTTMGIGLSVWWGLPFTSRDEDEMRKLGYGDAWIRYMKRVHDQNTRTLVTHEIADQAVNIGKGVDQAFQDNDIFRLVFHDILPDRDCTWNNMHKFQKRLPGGDATTGTFEYRGVGQALQGIHVNNQINDDNVGREAQQSVLRGDGRVMKSTISWFQQCGTRFDPDVGERRRQVVIGNPWCHGDLNDWIKQNLTEFTFQTHDAEGGCCMLHPKGRPILPEAWTMELLQAEKHRLEATGEKGDYEHFYRCMHVLPGERIFDKDELNFFRFRQSRPDLALEDLRNILLLEHEVKEDGKVIDDFQPGGLALRMVVGPNDAKKVQRTEHVIWVIGYDTETMRIYLMSLWAEDCKYSELVEEIYRTAQRWKLSDFSMSEQAKDLLDFYMRQRDRLEPEKTRLAINTFPDDDQLDGMKNRIEALEPLMKQIWAHRGSQKKFLTELQNYPTGKLDTLDVLGYFPQTMDIVPPMDEWMRKQQDRFQNRGSGAGGY